MINSDLVTVYVRLYETIKEDDWSYFEALKSSRFNFLALNESVGHLSVVLNGAIKHNKNDFFIALSQAGVNVFEKEMEDGLATSNPALHVAAAQNNITLMKYMLELEDIKDNIDVKNLYHETPLYLATCKNHDEIVRLLLEKKANYLLTDEQNNTILHQAAHFANLQTFQHFLSIAKIDKHELLNQVNLSHNKYKHELIDVLSAQIEKEQLENSINNTSSHKIKTMKL